MPDPTLLTAEHLRSRLDYEPDTGIFTWRVKPSKNRHAGAVAGSFTDQGYIKIGIDKRDWRAHRLAWLWVTGEHPATEIDHINGIRYDNRFCNLRPGEHRLNLQNLRSAKTGNKSGFLGVTKKGARFMAAIKVDGRVHYLGTFDVAEVAHAAYVAAKRELHPYGTL